MVSRASKVLNLLEGELELVGQYELTKELSSDYSDNVTLPPGTKVEVRKDPNFRANTGVYFIYKLDEYPDVFTKVGSKYLDKIARRF